MEKANRSILLISRPEGMPSQDNFQITTNPIPNINEDEVLVRAIYLSVDPYMRGRMSGKKTYIDPFKLNKPLIGGVVGKVVESKNSHFQVGDIVQGYMRWADYSVSEGKDLRKIDPTIAPISTSLGVVGMPGLTAYVGLLDIGKPKKGETVVISGAAGAVGTVVGQIAKLKGCRVVGISGSDKKNKYLENELGFDETINYKTENVNEELKVACPNGVDIYFDNVGGSISDAVMKRINFFSRIVLCGQISQYNNKKVDYGPRMQQQILTHSAIMQGFIIRNYTNRYEEGFQQLGKWVKEGKIKYRETTIEGLENAPDAFIGLFHGENIGKQLVKVSDE
nr:NADP-dependent oxidoreductase [Oceanobacillus salinisoli]